MKRMLFLALFLICLAAPFAVCEESSWASAPTITRVYEVTPQKLFIEWEGNAPLYQVNMDGKDVASVMVNSVVIPIKKGTHSIIVHPLNDMSKADTNINIGMGMTVFKGNINLDLAALGLDAKKIVAGAPSKTLVFDFADDPIFSVSPDAIRFETDFDDRVVLSVDDPYVADEYLISIKNKSYSGYVRYNASSEQAASLISRTGSMVSLILDPAFLQQQGCVVPALGKNYTFAIQFRKNAFDYAQNGKVGSIFHDSKESKSFDYTPKAAWKNAPEITYASQTAEGEITIGWNHEDHGLGCEYYVMKANKTLGITSGKEKLLTTKGNEAVISDLLNDTYALYIVPHYNREDGTPSDRVEVKVENSWVVAPVLACEQADSRDIVLSWDAAEGVDSYHIIAYVGDRKSLLHYVNMDYKKYGEYEISVTPGEMQYTFSYDGIFDQESGERLKFEVYGVHTTTNGDIQKSSTSSCSVTLQ